MKYDYAITAGRFEPLHLGHQDMLEFGATQAKEQIILIGSAQQARTPKNPFTAIERLEMIADVRPKAIIRSLRDFHYSDDNWVAQVQETIDEITQHGKARPKICLVGHMKDASSYYLRMFPQWDFIDFKPVRALNATNIREYWLAKSEAYTLPGIRGMVPQSVYNYMDRWTVANPEIYDQLVEEAEYYKTYEKQWGQGPHLTTDALVTCGGHVLLVQRADCPGKGLWALPGGFLGLNERFEAGALRELREETNIDCPDKVLRGSIKSEHTFDHPYRSLRGRVITHAYHIALRDIGLPKVKGASDAKEAKWFKINWVKKNPHLFFDDHYHIIEKFLWGG